jgi:phospholipid-binding lipoprotein MlaA
MKTPYALRLVLLIGMMGLATGCASQTVKKEALQTDSVRSVPGTEATPAEASVSALTAEEEALFDDDLNGWKEEEEQQTNLIADPIEPFNRVMFKFNEKLYDWLLRPVALGYRNITPQEFRVGLNNFFNNLTTPIRFTNCLLQGKGQAAAAELSKFIFNSTFGVLGFGDLFQDYPEMYPDSEDLGQTFGSYGAGEGFYLVWPILGPSTLRDTIGFTGDVFLNPLTYVDSSGARLTAQGADRINKISFRIEDIDAARQVAFDPYEAARNFTIQTRRSKVSK